MINDIIENLTNYAMDLGYGVELNPLLKPDVPSFVSNKRQLIVINTNTEVQEEIPLQLAHEIGHVLNNDRKLNKYYYTYAKYGVEKDANVMALILLAPYYIEDKPEEYITVDGFMETFAIPEHQRAIAEQVLFG